MKTIFYTLTHLLKTFSEIPTTVKRKSPNIVPFLVVLCVSLMLSDCSKKSDPIPSKNSPSNTPSSNTTGQVIFWTASATLGGSYIDIYVNGTYKGQITVYHSGSGTPACGASGYVTITGTPGTYNWNAVGQDGSKWSNKTVSITSNTCSSMQLI